MSLGPKGRGITKPGRSTRGVHDRTGGEEYLEWKTYWRKNTSSEK